LEKAHYKLGQQVSWFCATDEASSIRRMDEEEEVEKWERRRRRKKQKRKEKKTQVFFNTTQQKWNFVFFGQSCVDIVHERCEHVHVVRAEAGV